MSSREILKEQLDVAHGEYQELKVELGELQKRWDSCLERLIPPRSGQEALGSVWSLEREIAEVQDRKNHVQQMMNKWLTVIEECIKAIREVAIHC